MRDINVYRERDRVIYIYIHIHIYVYYTRHKQTFPRHRWPPSYLGFATQAPGDRAAEPGTQLLAGVSSMIGEEDFGLGPLNICMYANTYTYIYTHLYAYAHAHAFFTCMCICVRDFFLCSGLEPDSCRFSRLLNNLQTCDRVCRGGPSAEGGFAINKGTHCALPIGALVFLGPGVHLRRDPCFTSSDSGGLILHALPRQQRVRRGPSRPAGAHAYRLSAEAPLALSKDKPVLPSPQVWTPTKMQATSRNCSLLHLIGLSGR